MSKENVTEYIGLECFCYQKEHSPCGEDPKVIVGQGGGFRIDVGIWEQFRIKDVETIEFDLKVNGEIVSTYCVKGGSDRH